MSFSLPENLDRFSREGLADLERIALDELKTLKASISDPETATDEQVTEVEALAAAITTIQTEKQSREDRLARLAATDSLTAEPGAPVVASAETPVKDVAETATAPEVGNAAGTIVAATVTHSTETEKAPLRSVQPGDIAPLTDAPELPDGAASQWVIRASVDSNHKRGGEVRMGQEVTMEQVGEIFANRAIGLSSNKGLVAAGGTMQLPIAQIERQYKPEYVLDGGLDDLGAYKKLEKVSQAFNSGADSVTAGIAWCAPSPVDYSTCNPIAVDGLFQAPEVLAPRGGLRHNQGLAFSDFFGGDFVLPITGYNILTEAQVIADTAKTCFTIPCPPFVDDRLNVAALCLTGNILQNRAYPEFVAEFTRGATAAMAHLVNREILAEIVTGSTAVNLSTVDPWLTDGTVVSQVLSAAELAAMDIRYFYRSRLDQRVTVVLPAWLKAPMRADWIRRNAFQNSDDLADAAINAMFSLRGIDVQWVMDFQDAFAPTNGAGAIIAGEQLGTTGVAVTNRPFTFPTSVSFLAYLPGTWVIARNSVIRLDMVYDSTKLATNQVTQLFVEDGYKPMRMCTESRYYTVPICASGSTGAQRAVACTDVTP